MEVKESRLKQQLDIIYRPHPVLPSVDCKFVQQEWKSGQTVREILVANGVDQFQPIVVILNDRLLTVQEWDTICPVAGDLINVKSQVAGGGNDTNKVLNTVLMVAVVAAAILLVQPELVALGWSPGAVYAGTAAFMIAGSLIVNALVPIKPPGLGSLDAPETSGSTNATQAYSLSGGSNQMRPYQSMPIVMGTHRFFPDLGSKPYTAYLDNDQYLYQIFHFGISDLSLSDFKIGTTLLTSYSDYQWTNNNQYGQIIEFPGNVDSAAGALLTNEAGWIVRTTSSNTYSIQIDISGVLYYANDRGGLDNTSVQLRIQYKPVGTSTWLDPTNIVGGGPGFAVGSYETYSHYVEQGYWVTNYSPENPSWNEETYWVDESYYETRTRFVVGSGGTILISGNSQTPSRASLFIPVSTGTYDVRIIRDTADSTDSRLQNKTSFDAIRSHQQDSATYYGQTRRGLIIRASEQLNGSIQQLSCQASARANYWTGSAWLYGETSNPAHWFQDFARGRYNSEGRLMYGLGFKVPLNNHEQYIDNYSDLTTEFSSGTWPWLGATKAQAGSYHWNNFGFNEGRTMPMIDNGDSQVDLGALAAWGGFCATEGLTFNAVFDGQQSCADILTTIARCGFASPSWSTGKLGIVWDGRNQSPVAQFGMGNIIKNSFSISYATESLADEIIVRFVNPAKDYDQDEVRANVPGVDESNNPTTVDLMGCTSQAMAGKFANYIAAQQYYRKRRISWDTDFEGFVCQRGDVVLLSHDLTQWGYSGRIVSVDGNTITLDRSVPRNGSVEYFMIRQPNGNMTTYSVSSGSGSSNELTLTSTPTFQDDYLPIDHIWSFSPLVTPGKKVKIISVQPKSESLLTVTATDEYGEFYGAWDGSYQVPPSSTLLLNNTAIASNLITTEMIYRGLDNSIKSEIALIWDVVGQYDKCNLRYRVKSGVWQTASVVNNRFRFDTQDIGKLEVQIVPISGFNVGNPYFYEGWVYGVTLTLPNVTNFNDFFREGKTVLRWDLINDPRQIEYEIRKGTDWDKAQILARVVGNEFATDGDGTYWVAARTSNLYSPVPVSIVIEGSTLVANVVATWDEESTGWTGTLGGGAQVSGGNIELVGDPIPSEGSYEIPSSHIVDVGTAQPCNISVSYRMTADSPYNLVSLIPVFSEITSLVGKYAGDADVKIQIAIAPDSGIFGDWRTFIPGTYVGRKFKMRALLYSYDQTVTPVLDKLIFTVDMPDRVERGTNVSCASGGISVTYSKDFQITPNVQVTVLNAVANDDIVLANETESGFDVKIINGATDVARNINWIAQGY